MTAADFNRMITLNGDPTSVAKRAVVLVFTPTNYATPQTVYLYAVNDSRAEGDRVVISAQSVISRDARFDHATVRNVEVTVGDNDQADVVVTELDTLTTLPDNNTIRSSRSRRGDAESSTSTTCRPMRQRRRDGDDHAERWPRVHLGAASRPPTRAARSTARPTP